MRKSLFFFAMAVVTAAMVSCGNKTGEDEGTEVESDTLVEQPATEQEVAIEDQTQLD